MINSLTSLYYFACTPQQAVWGIPTWYKYLPGETDPLTGACVPFGAQSFDASSLNVLLGIGLALGEILLRVAAIVAIAYIIYGGFQYLMSQGEPSATKKAKDTILNAIIGLAIAILATAIVNFIGTRLTS
jgi:hypothetical protein